ncbi:hypothetical protein IMSHALPRED_001306 [Imshaugia aleurites]|uniref:ferric-chelate reductase (NADPH) n=1 Tax=Imshaugia aleurites TaxID=172621 RepID=A0A8H3PEX3_9LECA|nr:hypothetical protein IMSHALPRED_001306 [Imshaugia aleurites]
MVEIAPPAVAAGTTVNDMLFSYYTLTVLGAIVISMIVYRIVISSVRHIRALTCLSNDSQRYFKMPNRTFGWIKQHLLYAPLLRSRHQEQMRIGPMKTGILPTRFQSLLLAGIITMNVVLCAYGIEWNGPITTKLEHLRNRSGTLAVVDMIPLVIMAGRNNPLIGWLDVSYDTFNLMHRWFGRIVASLAVSHGTVEITLIVITGRKTHTPGWESFSGTLKEVRFITFGLVALVAVCAIILTSWTAFRHAFYETFLHIHIALVSLVMAALWIHLDGLQQMTYLKAVISIWVIERLIRLASLIYRNVARGGANADVEILPGDAMLVTLRLVRPWTFKPGQHIFLTMPSIGLWTSHPFAIAWSDAPAQQLRPRDLEKGPQPSIQTTDTLALPQTSISLIIRRRAGFTQHLHRKALDTIDHRISLPAFVEGPYGGTQTLRSYGTVMLFAGGVGITHSVPFVRDLVAGYASGTVAAQRVLLVWIIRAPEHLEWIRPWMSTILSMPGRRDVLRIQLFITRPRSTKEIHSPSSTVQMFPGKPNVDALVAMESREQVGAMAVSVCGPGGLADDVRSAVRRRQGVRNVDFLEQGFGW